MTEQLPEIALTSEEVAEVLTHCGEAALLVGGQALALECDRLAGAFNALVNDVAAAAKVARPKK